MEDDRAARSRLTSPEALDGYIRVTPRPVWLTLTVVLVLMLAALAWGIFGTVTVRDAETGEESERAPIYFVIN